MAQSAALAKPKFIKVKQLQNLRNGYNVYVKVVAAEHRLVQARDGLKIPMVDAVVADQTGSSKAFFKGQNAHLIQKGNTLAIRNGVVRLVKDHISLEVDLFGRVTQEKDVTVNPTDTLDISAAEHKKFDGRRDNRQGGNRQGGNRQGGNNRNYNNRDRNEGDERPRRNNYNNYNRQNREGGYKRQDRQPRGDRTETRGENKEPRGQNRGQDRRTQNRGGQQRGEYRGQNRGQNRGENRGENRNPRNLNNRQNQNNFDRNRQEAPRNQGRRNYDRDYDRGQGRSNNYDRNDRNDRNNEQREGGYRGNREERGDRPEYRPRRQYAEKREQFRGDRKPLNWSKIGDLTPGDDGLNLNVKIITLTKVTGRNTRYRCVIGDSTGISNAFLPQKIELAEGDTIVLFNARAEVTNEHIEIQLANNGRIELSRKPVDKVNEEFNLSGKAWVPIEE